MISWRRIKLCRYYVDGKSTVNRLTWYCLNAPARRVGSEEHVIKLSPQWGFRGVALSSLGCPNVCLSYAPMSRDKPYIFWKLLVQGYQNWYPPVHIMKWQKNLTYDICLKREIFKDTKINMYHLWPETILLQQLYNNSNAGDAESAHSTLHQYIWTTYVPNTHSVCQCCVSML